MRTHFSLNIFLTIILILATLVRFYNFPNRINFGPEQAISLLTSASYIEGKTLLLGLPNVQRFTSLGQQLYSGSLFNYSLVPLMLLANYDPIAITAFFALLNILTGLLVYFIAKKFFGKQVAYLSLIFFTFNDLMISHSLFIWIINYLPLIGILTFYVLLSFKNTQKNYLIFILGVLSGVGFNLEYFYLFTIVLVLILTFFFSKNKLLVIPLFILGCLIGNLPMVLFDIKHQFFHTKLLWQYFIDTLASPGNSKISYYHFLQYFPVLAVLASWGLVKVFKGKKKLIWLIIALYCTYPVFSGHFSLTQALGMPTGLNFPGVNQAAATISKDNPKNFNLSSLFDFDSRAYPLRYLVKYRYGFTPQGVEDYPNAKVLYVFAKKDYDFDKALAWEINSYKPFKENILENIDNGFTVYKLTK